MKDAQKGVRKVTRVSKRMAAAGLAGCMLWRPGECGHAEGCIR